MFVSLPGEKNRKAFYSESSFLYVIPKRRKEAKYEGPIAGVFERSGKYSTYGTDLQL